MTRVEVALCSAEEVATDELSLQPVGLTQVLDGCSETEGEEWTSDEEGE